MGRTTPPQPPTREKSCSIGIKNVRVGQEAEYKEVIKQDNLSQRFVGTMDQLRRELDLAGGEKKTLVLAVDGSFCNRTCLRRRGTERS